MLSNYFKIAWRNIAGSPLFSAINVIGLAIGLACCILITVFVRYEASYDKHWANADRIYRVTRDFTGNNLQLAAVAPPIAPLLKQDFAEVEDSTRLLVPGSVTISRGETQLREEDFVVADANVFDFFNLEFVSGNPETALARPTDIVMSERAVQRYFGGDDPVGQTLNLMGQADVTVTAVIRDLPDNTHMDFEILGSMAAIPLLLGPDELESWGSNSYYTYIRLPQGFDPAVLEAKLLDFLIRHWSKNAESRSRLGLQWLPDIHLTSNRDGEWRANGSMTTVYTFSAIALFVLLIACINFMNLATARSTQRAREVGVRKVVGANRHQLVTQFLIESILLTAIAMLFAMVIVELLLPVFASYLEKPLALSLKNPATAATLLAGVTIVGLLAGSYPALYLSKFKPAEVLKGPVSGSSSALLRKGLVVFQFATSIALLIATGVVVAQMNFARNVDLGFDRSRMLVTDLPFFSDLWETYQPMKEQLEAHPDILSAVYSSRVPSMQNNDGQGYFAEGVQPSMENVEAIANIKVDYQWFDQYDVEMLAGRRFRQNEMRIAKPTEDNPVVNAAAVLNESAARRFGWSPEEAIGKIIRSPENRSLTMFTDREIVGVIPDIHFSSLHNEIKATVYEEPDPDYGRRVSVKLAPGNHQAAIAHFESVWKRLLPGEPVHWEFLDDRFDALYRSEQRQAQIFGLFALFAILVATLGLFGLAAYTTERRTKEIGIRKVMGASVKDIIWLLTSDFTKLVLLANVIAWPIAYFAMNQWLTRFVYKAPFSEWAWLFIAAGIAALIVAWLTISWQAARAAMARPILALRYE